MCGIAGFVRSEPRNKDKDFASLKRMCDSIAHRGPDAEGQWSVDDRIFFGHRRLSIIDLSEQANQPLHNEDGKITVVYNGEIYNYLDYQSRLKAQGHQFRSTGDTETLVHLYEEDGFDMLQSLNGMFAFSIWDARKQTLFCARDKFGIKPLYYTQTSDGIAFASEIKALLCLPEVVATQDKLAYWQYMSFRYVPGERTLFKGIKKLLPGHYLTWKPGGEMNITRWTDRHTNRRNNSNATAPVAEINDALELAIQRQMISDVPVGTFLSGGLDSSLTTALMCRTREPMLKVNSYTVGYSSSQLPGRNQIDRIEYVDDLAAMYPLKQTVIPPVIEPKEFLNHDVLMNLLWHMEEPVVDSAMINAIRISKAARADGTPVLLCGHGADEIFGGYRRHIAAGHLNKTRRIPKSLLGTAAYLSKLLPPDMYRIGQFLNASSLPSPRDLIQISFPNSPESSMSALSPDFLGDLHIDDVLEYHVSIANEYSETDPIDAALNLDQWTYLVDQNLLYMDKLSMAHSIESRVPFLDNDLFNLAASIPTSQLIHGNRPKVILNEAGEGLLPASILNRPKSGFGITFLYEWWKTTDTNWYDSIFNSAIDRGWYRDDVVSKAKTNARKGNTQSSDLLFSVLLSEIWAQRFLDS